MITKINPTSPEYQLNNKFPPDKEKSWPYPPERDGWVHANNALRGEVRMMKEALQAINSRGEPLKDWEIQAVNAAWESHREHIRSYVRHGDNLFLPQLKKRFAYPDKATDQTGVVKMVDSVDKKFHALKQGSRVDDALTEWANYERCVIRHLQVAQDIGLPLLRAYFTPKDIAPIILQQMKQSPKQQTGALIYFCGVERFRNEFMVQESVPSFVWYIDFVFKYNHFVQSFVKNLEAVKVGNKPSF